MNTDRTPYSTRQLSAGFTLIEVLVGLTIVAMASALSARCRNRAWSSGTLSSLPTRSFGSGGFDAGPPVQDEGRSQGAPK